MPDSHKGFLNAAYSGRQNSMYIHHAYNDVFSLARVFDKWVETSTEKYLNTFSVINTDANDLMAVNS